MCIYSVYNFVFFHIENYFSIPNRRVTFEWDKKIPNAATFTILKETHTLGNLIRTYVNAYLLIKMYSYTHPPK